MPKIWQRNSFTEGEFSSFDELNLFALLQERTESPLPEFRNIIETVTTPLPKI